VTIGRAVLRPVTRFARVTHRVSEFAGRPRSDDFPESRTHLCRRHRPPASWRSKPRLSSAQIATCRLAPPPQGVAGGGTPAPHRV